MLPAIVTLEQHQERLREDPEAYRPERCCHCGKQGLRRHGHYERNTPRVEGLAFSLGSSFMPWFYCPKCRGTCSRLPGCLGPRRQYWWQTQQSALEGLICGGSIREVARRIGPSRRTLTRWGAWLQAQFDGYSLHLCSRFADFGRAVDGRLSAGCVSRA
jgi:hypothetical protein